MPDARQRLVVALGGNAISAPGKVGTIDEQFEQVTQTAQFLCDAIERGHQLIVTHGNGPQVGNILRRVELASSELYPIPLEVCVADTQAGMGYMIAQCLANAMGRRHLTQDVTAIVTTVLVDQADPAFAKPTKPIGPPLTAVQAEQHHTRDGWIVEQFGSQFRRVVPSPVPQKIIELPAIRRLIEAGQVVVCCGGGGIPVYVDGDGLVHGAAAVIDKDRTTGLLAHELDVQTLVILTAVECAYLDFGTPQQQALKEITVEEAQHHVDAGQFGSGSMRPKVEAAIAFIRRSPQADAAAIIARLDQLTDALDGKSGTRVIGGGKS